VWMLALDQSKSPNLALHAALALVPTNDKVDIKKAERINFLKNFIILSPVSLSLITNTIIYLNLNSSDLIKYNYKLN